MLKNKLKVKGNVTIDFYIKNKLLWLKESEIYSDRSKQTYLDFIILYSHPIEVFKNKDLCKFTSSEIIELFQNLPKIKERNASTLWSAINGYLTWGAGRGLCPQGNPCDGLKFTEVFNVNKEAIKSTYIKLDEFWNKINRYHTEFKLDYEKLIIPVLYRYGVDNKYLPYLEWTDIDVKDKILSIWNENRKDVIMLLPIDDNFIQFMYNVYKNSDNICFDDYNNINFNSENIMTVKEENKKADDSFGLVISQSTIYSRYNQIFKITKDMRMSIKDLLNSRKYDILFELLKEKGQLDINDITDVYRQFTGRKSTTGTLNLRNDFEIISDTHILTASELK